MDDWQSTINAIKSLNSPDDKVLKFKQLIQRIQNDAEFRKTINMDQFWSINKSLASLNYKHSGLKIAIVGYSSDLVGPWDPFDTQKGLPGSEECAVYASQELAKRGYSVTLYMNPPEFSVWRSPFSNPRWLPEYTWRMRENTESYDLVLMWRRFDVAFGKMRSKIVFFWPHDSPFNASKGTFPSFDGICILSEHHRKQFGVFNGFDTIPYTICGNGILMEHFPNPMNITNPYSLGYFSNYSRGLMNLILIWPEIKKEFAEATLSICYGRQTWNTMSQDSLNFLIGKIEEYKSLGVVEHGKVGHLELAEIMQKTSVWCYPCNHLGATETFCITAVKCQAAGCIPVTTRVGALNETVHPEAPNILSIENNQDLFKYKELLLSTLRRIRDSDPEEIKQERLKYIEFAKQYTWEHCVDKWMQLYESIKK